MLFSGPLIQFGACSQALLLWGMCAQNCCWPGVGLSDRCPVQGSIQATSLQSVKVPAC
jgi:hypothetical protein